MLLSTAHAETIPITLLAVLCPVHLELFLPSSTLSSVGSTQDSEGQMRGMLMQYSYLWDPACTTGAVVRPTLLRGSCRHVTSCAHAGLTHLDFCSRSSRRDEDITDEGAEALAGMTALRSLNLSGHKEITAEGLAFLADCTALTSLDLSGQPNIQA